MGCILGTDYPMIGSQSPQTLIAAVSISGRAFPDNIGRVGLVRSTIAEGSRQIECIGVIRTPTSEVIIEALSQVLRPGVLLQLENVFVNMTDLAQACGFQDFYVALDMSHFVPALHLQFIMERTQTHVHRLPLISQLTAERLVLGALRDREEFWENLVLDEGEDFRSAGRPVVFTDGSFLSDTNSSTGATVSEDQVRIFPVSRKHHPRGGGGVARPGSGTSERMALKRAIKSAAPGTVIASDSQQALASARRGSERVQNGEIHLAWVRGHSGVWGNELADQAAKYAHSLEGPHEVTMSLEEWKDKAHDLNS